MKSKSIIIAMFIINIILIGIIYNNINKNLNVINSQVIKEMSESTQVIDLNNQINALNANHTEYMNYIQNCKSQIATALTNQKVLTSKDATLETMAENIEKILEARTSDATATANDITEGKTAYVNGKLIIGNAADNASNIDKIKITDIKVLSSNYEGNPNLLYDGEVEFTDIKKCCYVTNADNIQLSITVDRPFYLLAIRTPYYGSYSVYNPTRFEIQNYLSPKSNRVTNKWNYIPYELIETNNYEFLELGTNFDINLLYSGGAHTGMSEIEILGYYK